MKKKLETLTHLAIIALCITVSAVLIQRHFLAPPAPSTGIRPGQTLELSDEMGLAQADKTLVMALAPNCRYCTESMPFYRDLIQRRDAEGSPLRVVALVGAPELMEAERTILESSDVRIDALAPADFPALGIPGTPMMMLVDRRGETIEVWKGRLTAEGQDGVFRSLQLDQSPGA